MNIATMKAGLLEGSNFLYVIFHEVETETNSYEK